MTTVSGENGWLSVVVIGCARTVQTETIVGNIKLVDNVRQFTYLGKRRIEMCVVKPRLRQLLWYRIRAKCHRNLSLWYDIINVRNFYISDIT